LFASALAYHRNSKFGCRNEKKVSEQASKQTPHQEAHRKKCTYERQTYQKQTVCSLSEIDGFKQLVKKRNSPLSVSVCGSLEKAQAQALSLIPISTKEKTDSPVVVVVVHAHTLSSKQDCVELRKLAAPFIHSFLVGLPLELYCFPTPHKMSDQKSDRGDEEEEEEEEEEENLTRTRISTHNAQEEEEIMVVRIINREENQSD
jgi:hypothetical protein